MGSLREQARVYGDSEPGMSMPPWDPTAAWGALRPRPGAPACTRVLPGVDDELPPTSHMALPVVNRFRSGAARGSDGLTCPRWVCANCRNGQNYPTQGCPAGDSSIDAPFTAPCLPSR